MRIVKTHRVHCHSVREADGRRHACGCPSPRIRSAVVARALVWKILSWPYNPAAMSLAPGARLGPYEIVAPLGAGGMGEVYRARDTRLNRDVAIKILPETFATDRDRVRRFEQEARSIAALNHPHICQIYDIGPMYLVLEYIAGAPPQGPMPTDELVRLAIQLASALEAAHLRGILHRDLKPDNIIVERAQRTAKLLDFGLARTSAVADVTQTADGVVVGTAAYMSPKQAEGRPVDARSDVFAMGAVLYELVSGRRAFDGQTVMQTLDAVRRSDPGPCGGPPRLERLIRRCLAKNPEARFQTMTALRLALEELAGDVATLESQAAQQSVAVLPFVNMSADLENEYFSDGLAEEIINALAHLPGLKVIARTSAFAFKGKHEDVRRIGESLGVRHLLEGSVRKAGTRIRITAQLVSVADGTHLWSERFDRELADIFAIQDEIAAAIAKALQVTLTGVSATRLHTPLIAAYDDYLKAMYYARQWTPDSLARAQEHFERAIALDPEFATARGEFGHLFARLAIYGLMPPRDAMPRARLEAQKALDVDASSPEGHSILGMVAAMYDYDWSEAERHFGLALTQPGVSSHVHGYYAHYCLLPLRRFEEALEHQALAVTQDPLNVAVRAERAICLLASGRRADALDELRRITELDVTFWFPYFILSSERALEGQWDEALVLAEQTHRLAPWFAPATGVLAAVLKRLGHAERAEDLVRRLSSDTAYVDPIGGAMFGLLCGELGEAASWSEMAIRQRQPAILFFLNVTARPLHVSPHWPALARMLRLPGSEDLQI